MSRGKVVIHFDGNKQELFDDIDFNSITVVDLLKRIQHRIYRDRKELIAVSYDYLCDGPDASEPLNDVRLHQIIEMLQQLMTQDSINEESESGQRPVELWLCNCWNSTFLFESSSTTDEQQYDSGDTRPGGNNDNSKEMHFQTTYAESSIPQPSCTEMDSFQNIPSQDTDYTLGQLIEDFGAYTKKSLEKPSESCNTSNGFSAWDELFEHNRAYTKSPEKPSESCNTSNESSNEDGLKFTNNCRKNQKKQYKTDVFPLNKNKKVKKSKSTNTKATFQTANKKRKAYKETKKYAFHLQAVEFKKGCVDGRYPRVQLPKRYLDLIQKGQGVPVFVAATKLINGRRYLDATKGFLINKKNPKIPLENPCIIEFKWIDREHPPPKDYPLKLALIQVSGDKNRKCKAEYNENFKLAQRTVDETSKYSDYNLTDDTNEPEEFQITVVPVKGDSRLEADWPMLTDSDLMHYVNDKSNKKQKTNLSIAGSSSVQEQLKTTQQNEEEEEEYDDDEEDNDYEEDNDDEDYDDEE